MNFNEERRLFYFVPYVSCPQGYSRLLHTVCMLPEGKSILDVIDNIKNNPNYKDVEFFEVFFRFENEWSKIHYFGNFRVVDFENINTDYLC